MKVKTFYPDLNNKKKYMIFLTMSIFNITIIWIVNNYFNQIIALYN